MAKWVDVIIYADWNSEIIDDMHPVLKEVWNIRHRVMVSLSMREYDEYISKKWLQRELYIREKALQLIQK